MDNELTDENFEEKIIKSSNITIVDFWAPWCGPCKMLTLILSEVSEELANSDNPVQIFEMNIDEHASTPSEYGVLSIPTLKMFKNGKVINTKVGLQSKEALLRWIKENAV